METLKHPTCTVGSATLSQLAFPWKATRIFPMGEIPLGQYSYKKNKKMAAQYGREQLLQALLADLSDS